jgi:uncharacterized protein (UPF0333 family)
MISSKGQATNEALVTLLVMLLIMVVGVVLMLHGMASVVLTKWASKTSHCLAQSRLKEDCISETTRSLKSNFTFHDVKVDVKTRRGIIHSEIQAHLLKQTLMSEHNGFNIIKASYDLEPSEYKRIP